MNLKRVQSSNQFTVGNLNDYINVINKTNVNGISKLQVSDFEELENNYRGLRCSYNITTFGDSNALKVLQVSDDLFLNIYLA